MFEKGFVRQPDKVLCENLPSSFINPVLSLCCSIGTHRLLVDRGTTGRFVLFESNSLSRFHNLETFFRGEHVQYDECPRNTGHIDPSWSRRSGRGMEDDGPGFGGVYRG